MSERCPIDKFIIGEDKFPEICFRQCEGLWEQAIATRNVDGPYDSYELNEEDNEAEANCNADSEFSIAAIHKVNKEHNRSYVIVDQCVEHNIDIGEQGYKFNCPNEE